jgi:hypothetical protein
MQAQTMTILMPADRGTPGEAVITVYAVSGHPNTSDGVIDVTNAGG